MKKFFWIVCIVVFCMGCKKEFECYAQKKDGGNIDSTKIPCKCSTQTISDLENSQFSINDTLYDIKCIEK